MKRIIFIHGYTSSSKNKKYRIIAKDLNKLGIKYSIPQLPGGEYPHSKDWLEIIDREVKKSNLPVILVGHSLGTRAALLYLDQFNKSVDTVILIAAFDNDYKKNAGRKDEHYSDFFEYSIDIKRIKKLANKFIVVHSRDDNDITYSQGEKISSELGAELISIDGAGHMGGEETAKQNAKIILDTLKNEL